MRAPSWLGVGSWVEAQSTWRFLCSTAFWSGRFKGSSEVFTRKIHPRAVTGTLCLVRADCLGLRPTHTDKPPSFSGCLSEKEIETIIFMVVMLYICDTLLWCHRHYILLLCYAWHITIISGYYFTSFVRLWWGLNERTHVKPLGHMDAM